MGHAHAHPPFPRRTSPWPRARSSRSAPAASIRADGQGGAPVFGAAGDRAQRLQTLRQAVEQGAYRPDPAAIAEALLRALAGGRRADR
ncbi:MAG: flagellar biosynthesis anti-sigma factor FlgM [Hydrogenibacillus schlegelii]|uniref:Flagellar biosynthesis anti-sigma factor FlgM n=1 Tax=Hydrogenibacillus schlegelii TaxID=1484 RepID=A0A947G8C0_HYDSH|nr:flagellar biosynthesis anti-sigma factor FlgM [Hydrogenibacillus schlegelii]